MKEVHTTTIRFPEISLATRDAHKLRGYFGNLFKEHSTLLHNHLEDGERAAPRHHYRYPLVQYKVIDRVPVLFGLSEGAELLIQLFLKLNELQINGNTYPVLSKNIESKIWSIGVGEDLYQYRFQTLWMALNQHNYQQYAKAEEGEKMEKLKRIAISNILAYYKSMDLYLAPNERILMQLKALEKQTQFKNKTMLAFSGGFTTNALLPDMAGIGKAVSRGFGTVQRL